MRGNKAYQAYKSGAQYGKFGDHKSKGGKVVKGVTGKIHIMGGVETDIMKTHGPEGERILAARNNHASVFDSPINEMTGYHEYGVDDFVPKWMGGSGKAYTSEWWTGPSSIGDQISESLQKALKVSKDYDPDLISEREQKGQFKDMMETSKENIIAGQLKTEQFIGENLQRDLEGFGRQEDRLDLGIQNVQSAMGDSTGAIRSAQTRTGLISDPSQNIRKVERAGTAKMDSISSAREDIWGNIAKAETQAEMETYQSKQKAQTALAQIFSDYMAATGETISDDNMSLLQDYMADNDMAAVVEGGSTDEIMTELDLLNRGSGRFEIDERIY